MDHVVYLDAKANELAKLRDGSKTMIIRGATGRKLPWGRVFAGDVLYFITNDGEGIVRSRAIVESVLNSEKMAPEESVSLVEEHQGRLLLTDAQSRKWAGKRYLVLIGITGFAEVEPFGVDKSNYGNMDDWLPVDTIETVRKPL